jgi:hypothetical protein
LQIEKLQFHKIIVFSLKNYKTVNFDFYFQSKYTISIKSIIIFEVKGKVSENIFTVKIRISKINKG